MREDAIWPLAVEQYHEMLRHGIIEEDDPVELLNGLLITRGRKSPAHRVATWSVRKALERVTPMIWHVQTHPSELPDYTRQQTYRDGEMVPVALSGEVVAQLPVADLLP